MNSTLVLFGAIVLAVSVSESDSDGAEKGHRPLREIQNKGHAADDGRSQLVKDVKQKQQHLPALNNVYKKHSEDDDEDDVKNENIRGASTGVRKRRAKPKPEDGKEEGKEEDKKPDADKKPDKKKPDKGKKPNKKPGKEDKKPDAGKKPDEGNPDEKKPDEGKPDEEKPDQKKPDEGKPEEGKPDQKKPDEGKPGKPPGGPAKPDKGDGKTTTHAMGPGLDAPPDVNLTKCQTLFTQSADAFLLCTVRLVADLMNKQKSNKTLQMQYKITMECAYDTYLATAKTNQSWQINNIFNQLQKCFSYHNMSADMNVSTPVEYNYPDVSTEGTEQLHFSSLLVTMALLFSIFNVMQYYLLP